MKPRTPPLSEYVYAYWNDDRSPFEDVFSVDRLQHHREVKDSHINHDEPGWTFHKAPFMGYRYQFLRADVVSESRDFVKIRPGARYLEKRSDNFA